MEKTDSLLYLNKRFKLKDVIYCVIIHVYSVFVCKCVRRFQNGQKRGGGARFRCDTPKNVISEVLCDD